MPDDAAVLTLELPSRPEAAGAARKALTALNGNLQLVSTPTLTDTASTPRASTSSRSPRGRERA